MSQKYVAIVLALMFVMAPALNARLSPGITDPLARIMQQSPPDSSIKVWVYFTDKDAASDSDKSMRRFSEKALVRRADIPEDVYDIPVSNEYIDAIRRFGLTDSRPSRWLNAVAGRVPVDNIEAIARLPFVDRVDIVRTHTRKPLPESAIKDVTTPYAAADYGNSYTQNHMLLTDSAHTLGFDGTGVLIAFLDTGYDTSHAAFDSMNIIATYDFINGDSIVNDAVPTASQTNHGTATLSACGAYAPGNLIGPAFGADYILAKTEDVSAEYQTEEDYWVQAIEWADSAGADIVSSSLGYIDWYTNADMDGNTAVTTVAADIATSRGILVVISAGNEGNDTWHIINAPADADSVVAVGAITSSGSPSSFTSYGPTADGRVKPEVVAMGSNTWCADDFGAYYSKSGTSLSAPLIAGAAALILQANPDLSGNPMAIRQRLIRAGSLYPIPDPNTRLGYGLPNVIEAMKPLRIAPMVAVYIEIGRDTTVEFSINVNDGSPVTFEAIGLPIEYSFTDNGDGTAAMTITGEASLVGSNTYPIIASDSTNADTLQFTVIVTEPTTNFLVGPNPFTNSLTIQTAKSLPAGYKIEIFTLDGNKVFDRHSSTNAFSWAGINQNGEKVASGIYIIRISADGIEEKVKVFKL